MQHLPLINAILNAAAMVLLIMGYVLIKRHREVAHRRCMVTALWVSVIFLGTYLVHHYQVGHVVFGGPPAMRAIYLLILVTHIPLAALVPVLALWTIRLGYLDRRAAHRRWARWTFPIWMYVSVTGVLIYLLVYQLFPVQEPKKILPDDILPVSFEQMMP